MNCEQLETQLNSYLDEELSPEDRTAVEAHLADCPSCRERLKDLQDLDDLLAAHDEVSRPPADFVDSVLAEVAPAEPANSWFGSPAWNRVAAAAVLLFGLLLGGLLVRGAALRLEREPYLAFGESSRQVAETPASLAALSEETLADVYYSAAVDQAEGDDG